MTPVFADDRALIMQYEQQLSDAITNGNPAAWAKYLDPDVIYTEEDDSYKDKEGMIKEVRPLPQDLGGEIKVELLSYHEDGDTAVALFRPHEIERYYGQSIRASYLLSTVWKKRADGWRQIEGQVLAEKTDPPSIALPASDLQKFAGTLQAQGFRANLHDYPDRRKADGRSARQGTVGMECGNARCVLHQGRSAHPQDFPVQRDGRSYWLYRAARELGYRVEQGGLARASTKLKQVITA